MATTYKLFETAERIEATAAEIYHVLADQLSGDPEAQDLFQRLEAEELQHASRVRLLAARYRHDPRLLGPSPDSAGLDRLLSEAQQALAAVRAGAVARTPAEARAWAAELEETFARAHAELIASAGHPGLREFFTQLAEQDRGHRELKGKKKR